jgi:ATP-binding cassette subfamily C protein
MTATRAFPGSHRRALQAILRAVPSSELVVLLALMLGMALSDGIGILLLVPMLADFGASGGASELTKLLTAWGLPAGLTPRLELFVTLVALRSILVFRLSTLRAEIQLRFADNLRQDCYAALVKADWRWLSGQRAADHNAVLISNSAQASVGLDQAIGLIASIATGLAMLAVSFVLSWETTLVALVCGLALLAALRGFRRRALTTGELLGGAQRGLHRHVELGLAQLREAKIFGAEAQQSARFGEVAGAVRDSKLAQNRDSALAAALVQPVAALLLAATAWAGLTIAQLPLAELLPLLLVLVRTLPLIERIQQGWALWLHSLPAWHEITALTDLAKQHAEPLAIAAVAPALAKAFVLSGVTLQHQGRDRPALSGLDLTISARTTVAVTGPSGAGKSTLADLLAGLVSPDSGSVLIDGLAIDAALRGAWRQRVAYVQQDPALFHGTIGDNLRWASPTVDTAAMTHALERASAQFVLALPDSLETVVGDKGLRLSGGERQRIALARALLRAPDLLILDEATSALDAANEAAILSAVVRLHGQMTIVIVGHRPAMLALADQVIELDGGRRIGAQS